jgi:hypothetical protein
VAAAALLEWATDLMAEFDAGRTIEEIKNEVHARLKAAEPDEGDLRWSGLRAGIDVDAFDYRTAWSRLTSRRGTAEQKVWDTVRLIAALDQRMIERQDLSEAAQRELDVHGGGRSIVTELAWIGRRADARVADLVGVIN